MFTIDSEARITLLPQAEGEISYDVPDAFKFTTSRQLSDLLMAHPGELGVRIWNQLPGVTPIHTPPGEKAAKFRNKQTAVERIWSKLAELYPDAILEADMPKKKENHAPRSKAVRSANSTERPAKAHDRGATHKQRTEGTRKSAWAEELTEELRKRFKPGDSFELQDIYKLIPQFQRRHKENHHIAARLRTTLAQDLRGKGVVKTTGKGQYRMA